MKYIKTIIRRARQSEGYTLLFAVIVSILLLSIGAFILSVSRKEFILSSSSRDSVYAFYAADSGLECAIENLTYLATSTFNPSAVTCGGNMSGSSGISTPTLQLFSGNSGTTTFYMLTGSSGSTAQQTQSGVASCATIQVGQYYDSGGGLVTIITSRGNNIGWKATGGGNGTGDCSITGPRKVERALQYTTSQN